MNLSQHLAKHFREVYSGGNWTVSNLKEQLKDISWQDATRKIHSLNSIVALTFHISYFVTATLNVLQGGPLDAHDNYSFDHVPLTSQEDWHQLLEQIWADGETFAALVEKMPEEKLWETMVDEKYGSYYRNIQGIIEHTHYHLGQIAIIKKMLSQEK